MTALFILTRAIHIGACLLFFSTFAFDRFMAVVALGQSAIAGYWQSRTRLFTLILLPLIFISGIAWFALVAVSMSGQPLQFETLKTVWMQTQFGAVCKTRLMLGIVAVIVSIFYRFKSPPALRKSLAGIQLFLSGGLLGSLAWAGHGQENSPWHLFADVLHLLAAGLWPTGLLPFALLLNKLRLTSEPKNWLSLVALVKRFSAISLGSVALLAATGIVNSLFLVGSLSNLFGQPYGRWLLAKIVLFCIAVAIGAINLLRLKPRLSEKISQSQSAVSVVAQLQFNVRLELFLGTAIVIVVAILGVLPP